MLSEPLRAGRAGACGRRGAAAADPQRNAVSMAMHDRDAATERVIQRLTEIYNAKIRPCEDLFGLSNFGFPTIEDSEFRMKPQVLLCGQYSTGKTSFIRYLIGEDFPGIRVGPEPTTDRFTVVMDGPTTQSIPGNALAVSSTLPYRGLQRFGVDFLNRFEGSQLPSPVLRNITLVDTPGVLSGEKQRVARGYDFVQVVKWFAARSDLIVLLFDAHKLDISDEFRAVILALQGNEEKVRCVLNKADGVDRQKLQRVYGALMWSLGKVVQTPEVLKVYVGSFWDEPLQNADNAELFEAEERDLMRDLRELPRNSAVRKINELVKRCRRVIVYCHLVAHLRLQLPTFGKEAAQRQIIDGMAAQFRTVMREKQIPVGDFPDIEEFKEQLRELRWADFPRMNRRSEGLIQNVESALSSDLPALMEQLPGALQAEGGAAGAGDGAPSTPLTFAGNVPNVPVPEKHYVADGQPRRNSSWAEEPDGAAAAGGEDPAAAANPFAAPARPWALDEKKAELGALWESLGPVDGKVGAGAAAGALRETGVPDEVLHGVWNLADYDADGEMDIYEFTIAMYLCDELKDGAALPETLPDEFFPPGR